MNEQMILWIIFGLFSLGLSEKYSKGIYMYVSISAFIAAMVSAYTHSFSFQIITSIHAFVFTLFAVETGFENLFWVLVLLSEFIFFVLFFVF
ncbi:MAG: hypothetical protein KAI53_02005 [Candidatus Aenigmarchaeota archaeon]|nr:hypothetical protein [Candidatus Aenigmarchaeota archaeon]